MNSARNKIYNYLLKSITEGSFEIDNRIPTEKELAGKFKTNRMVAHRVVKKLESEGIVRRNKRQGTIVIRKPASAEAEDLSGKQVQVLLSNNPHDHLRMNELTFYEVELRLNQRGISLNVSSLNGISNRQELEKLFILSKNNSAKVLLIFPDSTDSEFLIQNSDLLYRYYKKNVYVFERGWNPPQNWFCNVIGSDPFGEGILVGEYLLEKGLDRIIFVRIEEDHKKYWMDERERGLSYVLQSSTSAGYKFQSWKIDYKKRQQELAGKLKAMKNNPVLVSANDEQASWLLETAANVNKTVSKDFSLISFDNNPGFRYLNLTSVSPPTIEIGRMFGRLINDAITKKDGIDTIIHMKVASKIIERNTCS